jgi:hypothetical protein
LVSGASAPLFLSAVFKKILHQFGAFFFEYAASDGGLGMKRPVLSRDALMSVLLIIRAPYDAADLTPV